MKSFTSIKGQLTYTLVNDKQEVVLQETGENLVVNTGTTFLAQLLKGDSLTPMGFMGIGTVGTTPTPTDTTLLGEVGRVAVTSVVANANNTVYTATFPPGTGTGTIVEAGLFNNAVAGTMLSRSTNISVNKAAGDTLNIVWTITFVA